MYIRLSVFSGFLATLSILFSIFVSVYFMLIVVNLHASVFGFISGTMSLCTLHLNILYLRRKIRDWYGIDQLESIGYFALVSALLSTVCFGVYLSLGIVREQSYSLKVFNYYVAATFSALSSLWGFALLTWALFYQREQIRYPLLLCHNNRLYS